MFSMLDRFRGRSFKDRLLNLGDEFWDRRLRVQTFGFHPGLGEPSSYDWRVHYTPTPYTDIFRLLRMVNLRSDDVFVDLGAGMGRAVFAASWYGAGRSIGVEVVQNLCNKAIENYRQSRLARRNIEFICSRAQDYQNCDTTVLFMFHPFGEATVSQVLRNIELARQSKLQPTLRIIYVNPVYDFVLQQLNWLKCIARVPPVSSRFSTAHHYEATLWQSC
jgi:hypothetical protein